MTEKPTSPGWYQDPLHEPSELYWDGLRYTASRAKAPSVQQAAPPLIDPSSPGWYPDPRDPGSELFWNGSAYSASRASKTPPPQAFLPPRPPINTAHSALIIIAGVGLILGLILVLSSLNTSSYYGSNLSMMTIGGGLFSLGTASALLALHASAIRHKD